MMMLVDWCCDPTFHFDAGLVCGAGEAKEQNTEGLDLLLTVVGVERFFPSNFFSFLQVGGRGDNFPPQNCISAVTDMKQQEEGCRVTN